MKKHTDMKRILILLTLLLLTILKEADAYKYLGEGKDKNNAGGDKAEACLPAKSYTDLDINNVRARINTGGDMWWDLIQNPRYEIPKGSGSMSMFSGALWMAGIDVNGQLKCAAQRYRGKGNDFFTGPLTTDGTASITPDVCIQYDRHFKITRAEVEEFVANRNNPNYQRPKIIDEWPAHGDVSRGQDYFLAPFFDNNGDNRYNPDDGDYPYYNLNPPKPAIPQGNCIVDPCRLDPLADRYLFGDQTLWWVFNDKGNIHSETGGSPIGFEIRAQAFAFSTNDEINNMTFYNYQIINRSTYTLTGTYFSQWTDTDLGYAFDDFVGCDVGRGLGYCYNGDPEDDASQPNSYGAHPPAIGVDFFQGPYMDPDGMDNPKGIDEGINGVNFGDCIIDNERFGMRRFVFHNNIGTGTWATQDPEKAYEYYLLLRGIWKDGTKMIYGGTGHISGACPGYPIVQADFMFPGDTDPWHWGTGYMEPPFPNWTEEYPCGPQSQPNTPYDRRFMHSAGPFTLKPGAVNFITVGIPWARTTSGTPWQSVLDLKLADDKCQALFDNCFRIIDGPDAPDLTIRELDRKLILWITNPPTSNNYKERYKEQDYNIKTPEGHQGPPYDDTLRFQGYQIFQVKDASVSVADLDNPALARLVAQCDIKDNVSRIINYEYNQNLGAAVPVEKVNGENKGIRHSFVIEKDMFATGDNRLVNHKKYYYIAIAYAYNNYKTYDPTDPNALDGQKTPYKASRKGANGPIRAVCGIPHKTEMTYGGSVIVSEYGMSPKITRVEGQGNGGNILDLTPESEQAILANNIEHVITYKPGFGPINVKVLDPLNVLKGNYTLKFNVGNLPNNDYYNSELNKCGWILTEEISGRTWTSDNVVTILNEQLIPEIGLSITIEQPYVFSTNKEYNPGDKESDGETDAHISNGFLWATIEYADSSVRWLSGISDQEQGPYNWIRSGTLKGAGCEDDHPGNWDNKQVYERVLNGIIAPYVLTSYCEDYPHPKYNHLTVQVPDYFRKQFNNIASIDLVFTPDKSKWSRCPIIEMCPDKNLSVGGVDRLMRRRGQSVDKNGNYAPVGSGASNNPNDPNFISEVGMTWFPGYAINVETGERLNIMVGENSWIAGENGADMLYNPTNRLYTELGQDLGGGYHYVYIMGHNDDGPNACPSYDHGSWLITKLKELDQQPTSMVKKRMIYESAMWVGLFVPARGLEDKWLHNEARIKLRVVKPYKRFFSTKSNWASSPQNNNFPMYRFSTDELATKTNIRDTLVNALDLINVVPNPYYAYSSYETSPIDNRVRIINLPEKCKIRIYSLDGTLIRSFDVDKTGVELPKKAGNTDAKTSIDWDLKNHAGIPISSGVYLIHVKAEGIGERVIKWFGTMRPTQVDSF